MLQHYFVKTILIFSLLAALVGCQSQNINVLVFTKANGFVHESRIAGAEAIKNLEESYPINVIILEDSLIFNDENFICHITSGIEWASRKLN